MRQLFKPLTIRQRSATLQLLAAVLLAAPAAMQADTYDLTVLGTEVTTDNAEAITGYGISADNGGYVAFDAATNTLTLSNVMLYTEQTAPLIVSGLTALTIRLEGYVGMNFNDVEETFVIQSTNPDAVLTFTPAGTDAMLSINTTVDTDFDGFAEVRYEGGLVYMANADYKMIKPLSAPQLFGAGTDADGHMLLAMEPGDNPEGTEYYFSIDYADDALEDAADVLYDMDGAPEVALLGPATVTAYTQYDGAQSETVTAKFFGHTAQTIRAVYGTESVELPAVIPAIAETDGLTVSYSTDDETIATEADGTITLGGAIGSTTLSGILEMGPQEPPYTVLNSDYMLAPLTIRVVPPTPEVSLEPGTYNEPKEMTVTSTLPQNVAYNIHYYRETGGVVDNDSTLYSSQLRVDATCTLYIYQQSYDAQGAPFYSDTLALHYTIIPPVELPVSYAQNSRTWASYFNGDTSLETPEGLEAYVVTEATATGVSVELAAYIPVGKPVLLKRVSDDLPETVKAKVFLDEETLAGTTTAAEWLGAEEDVDVSTLSGNAYVLYNDGFTRTTKGTVPARRGYLLLAAGAAPARLAIMEERVTTLVNSERMNSEKEHTVYNLHGQRMAAPVHKGLYIVNGRKTVINR